MAQPLHQGDGVDVEREAGTGFVADNAALAEDVLGGEEPLFDGGPHAALKEDRLVGLPRLFQEGEVLHVAAADLEDVRESGDEFDVASVHDLGDYGQASLSTGPGEDIEPLFAVAAEGVGAGAGLKGASAEHVGASGLDRVRRLHHVLFGIDGAGASDDHQTTVAHLY